MQWLPPSVCHAKAALGGDGGDCSAGLHSAAVRRWPSNKIAASTLCMVRIFALVFLYGYYIRQSISWPLFHSTDALVAVPTAAASPPAAVATAALADAVDLRVAATVARLDVIEWCYPRGSIVQNSTHRIWRYVLWNLRLHTSLYNCTMVQVDARKYACRPISIMWMHYSIVIVYMHVRVWLGRCVYV